MRGFPLIEKDTDRKPGIITADRINRLLASAAVGVIAGVLTANVRLHLGLPGHKALLWMTPIIVARLLTRFNAGATIGSLFAGGASLMVGGHIAGGWLGTPILGLAGLVADLMITFVERKRASFPAAVLIIGAGGAIANLLCLAKRLLMPAGIAPHFLFGLSGLWFKFVSYAFFGFAAGAIGALLARLIQRKQRRSCHDSHKT